MFLRVEGIGYPAGLFQRRHATVSVLVYLFPFLIFPNCCIRMQLLRFKDLVTVFFVAPLPSRHISSYHKIYFFFYDTYHTLLGLTREGKMLR